MRQLILGVMLACSALNVEAVDIIGDGPPVPAGGDDLLQNATLSQPFTIFDQLLLSLDRKASEVAENFRPEKNDFRPARAVSFVSSRVWYDKVFFRTVIEFGLDVSGMDDPWRDVCAKRLRDIINGPEGLWLPSSKADVWQMSSLMFFSPILGPHKVSDDAQLAKYKPFSDSIMVALIFSVKSGDRPKPLMKFSRQCFWDNKTGQVIFREHKY